MGINKVIYNGQVLVDLTSSTVTPETLLEGVVAFNSSGDKIVGTYVISTYTNQVPLSINEDGTIYNSGLGYKNKTRVRSGGAEGSSNDAACTGYIPVKPGDIIRLKGWDMKLSATSNCINISDANFNNLGQWSAQYSGGYGNLAGTGYATLEAMVEEGNGVYKWQIPPADFCETAYIRVSGSTGGSGLVMIVTVNEEIK